MVHTVKPALGKLGLEGPGFNFGLGFTVPRS